MHSFNNPFAKYSSKTQLWRVHPKDIVRKNFNTKTSTTVKRFLYQCIVLTILLQKATEKLCYGEWIGRSLLEIFQTLKICNN